MKTPVLARDSLKKNQLFTVLYELILYVAMPIAFELSFVKILQKSMSVYHSNDLEAFSRLAVYFAIQWFLGVLVRRSYLKATMKRIALALLILLHAKEAFFEEVLFDMMLSIIMESGLMILLFFQFAQLIVILKMTGLFWVFFGSIILMGFHIKPLLIKIIGFADLILNSWNIMMNRIRICWMFIIRNIRFC
jgi:hypothetical protein